MAKTYHIRMRRTPVTEADYKKAVKAYFTEHPKAAKTVRYINRGYVEVDGTVYHLECAAAKAPLFWAATLTLAPGQTEAKPDAEKK